MRVTCMALVKRLCVCCIIFTIDKWSSNECHVVVRTTAKNETDMRQWLSEFAHIAGVSYVVDKVYNADRKSFREEYVCHHSNRNNVAKSDCTGIVDHENSLRCKLCANIKTVQPELHVSV